jgi:O-antigen ligase
VNSTFNTENPNEISSRISSIALTSEDDSINERLGYYSDAVQSIMNNPIIGVGIGNWKIKSIDYAGQSVSGYTVPYHVHNDFLQITAEIGIVGGLIYLMIYLFPIYSIIRKNKNQVLDNLNLVYILVILAIYIDSMLNFPMSRPVNHIFLLFTLVAIMQTPKTKYDDESS